MRINGCIDSAAGLGADGHACWGFDQEGDFADAALEFLTDGLRLNQQIGYISSEPVADQRERLAPLGDVGGMIDRGALQLIELKNIYRPGEPVDVDAQLALYSAAADAARSGGFTGLRVASQATDFVAEPETWDDRLRWESAADRVLSASGISVLCGYRCDALPPSLLSDLAAVHPAANADAKGVDFHLFGEGDGLTLSGEVDFFSSEALDRILRLACCSGEPLSLDLGPLEFIDHHGLEVLAAHAADDRCRVHSRPSIVERLCDLLELEL